MSFQIALDPDHKTQALMVEDLFEALQKTFAEEAMRRGLTQSEMAEKIGVDPSTVNKWMNLKGNPTIKTISKLYYAMSREGWSNLKVPDSIKGEFINIDAPLVRIKNELNDISNEINAMKSNELHNV